MSSTGSGPTHIRFGHACRARDLEVKCPRCFELADARKPSEVHAALVIGDLDPSWMLSDWEIACRSCVFRAVALSYQDLPPRYWSIEVGNVSVWGWNREHLAFVRRCLLKQAERADPYAWLAAYIPGEWKADAVRISKAISKKIGAD